MGNVHSDEGRGLDSLEAYDAYDIGHEVEAKSNHSVCRTASNRHSKTKLACLTDGGSDSISDRESSQQQYRRRRRRNQHMSKSRKRDQAHLTRNPDRKVSRRQE